MDMSIYKTNTKKHPIYMVPEARIEIFEDIPRLHVITPSIVGLRNVIAFPLRQIQLFAEDMRTEKTLANRTFDFCDLETFVNSNVFFHSLLHHMLDNMDFALKCPFKKVIRLFVIRWLIKVIDPAGRLCHERAPDAELRRPRPDEIEW